MNLFPISAIATDVWITVGAGLLISLVAFGALILAPAVGAFGRTWEKFTAVLLSLFVLAALVGVGVALGVLIVLHWDQISGLVT
jgi:hypothetical protein